MLIVCEDLKEYFESIMDWAKKNDQIYKKFLGTLQYLDMYGNSWLERRNIDIVLFKDFAPYSFTFNAIRGKDHFLFNGGVICHNHEMAKEMPHMVTWQVHT
jgi:hypothetical protein